MILKVGNFQKCPEIQFTNRCVQAEKFLHFKECLNNFMAYVAVGPLRCFVVLMRFVLLSITIVFSKALQVILRKVSLDLQLVQRILQGAITSTEYHKQITNCFFQKVSGKYGAERRNCVTNVNYVIILPERRYNLA